MQLLHPVCCNVGNLFIECYSFKLITWIMFCPNPKRRANTFLPSWTSMNFGLVAHRRNCRRRPEVSKVMAVKFRMATFMFQTFLTYFACANVLLITFLALFKLLYLPKTCYWWFEEDASEWHWPTNWLQDLREFSSISRSSRRVVPPF